MTNQVELMQDDRFAVVVADLEPESALALRSSFAQLFAQAEEWTARAKQIRVTSVEQKRDMKMARESRLALREIRVRGEHARKRLKEDSVRRGKAIDGAANILKALIEPIEEYLLEQETFTERHEAARKAALREERAEALRAFGADVGAYSDLGEMGEDTWSHVLDGAKTAHEARVEEARRAEAARAEAARIAAEKAEAARVEAARIEAERVAREKAQAEENARLRAEREALEAQHAAERKAAREAAERAAAEARAAREAIEAEARKARAEADRVARELAAERAKVEAARQAEEARQAVEAARVAAEARAAATAPDREKLAALAVTIRAIALPEMATDAGRVASAKVAAQIEKLAAWVEKTGATL